MKTPKIFRISLNLRLPDYLILERLREKWLASKTRVLIDLLRAEAKRQGWDKDGK
jgi:hypothetical protein